MPFTPNDPKDKSKADTTGIDPDAPQFYRPTAITDRTRPSSADSTVKPRSRVDVRAPNPFDSFVKPPSSPSPVTPTAPAAATRPRKALSASATENERLGLHFRGPVTAKDLEGPLFPGGPSPQVRNGPTLASSPRPVRRPRAAAPAAAPGEGLHSAWGFVAGPAQTRKPNARPAAVSKPATSAGPDPSVDFRKKDTNFPDRGFGPSGSAFTPSRSPFEPTGLSREATQRYAKDRRSNYYAPKPSPTPSPSPSPTPDPEAVNRAASYERYGDRKVYPHGTAGPKSNYGYRDLGYLK